MPQECIVRRRRSRGALLCWVASTLLWSAPAFAQRLGAQGASESEREPAPEPKQTSTHFLLEGGVGLSLANELGYQGGGAFGAGGRLPGTPLRFYFMTSVYCSRMHRDTQDAGRLRFDVFAGVGVRTYLPVFPGVRLYAELLGGAQRASDTVTPASGRALHMEAFRPELRLGGGFQVRPVSVFSIGAGVVYRVFEDEFESVSKAQRLAALSPWMANVTVAWHF